MAGKNNVAGNNGDISVKGRILDRDIGTIIAKLIVECNAGVEKSVSRVRVAGAWSKVEGRAPFPPGVITPCAYSNHCVQAAPAHVRIPKERLARSPAH